MVKLETHIQRWIGLSLDTKPQPTTEQEVPVGSSFLETDTGKIYRWDGQAWQCAVPADETLYVLQKLLVELTQLRELVEVATS